MTSLKELYEIAKEIHPFAYIAGGFYKDIRKGKEPKDIDIFFYNNSNYNLVCSIISDYTGIGPIFEKANCTIGKYQIVKPIKIKDRLLYGKPENLVPTFDIDIGRFWIDNKGLHSTEDIEEMNYLIDINCFNVSLFHEDEQRSFDRRDRYENDYGYTCLRIIREEHISKKSTNCSMGGGY